MGRKMQHQPSFDDVFEAHAEPSREIDPGCHAECVTRFERASVARHEIRVLVCFGPDPVPDAVHEVLAETGVGNDVPAPANPFTVLRTSVARSRKS